MFLSETYEEFLTYPVVKYCLSVGRAITSFTKDSFKYYVKNYNLRTILEITLSRMNIYFATSIRILDFWYNSGQLLSYIFEYDPSSHLHYDQVLPIYWNKFGDFPRLMIIGHKHEESNFDVTHFYMQAHNIVREFLSAISSKTLMPPFSSTAMLVGDNQVKTFDGKFYKFSANCSYLLTRDFNLNRFSIYANFENMIRKSVSIQIEDNHFSINKDGKMLWNNNLLDLPLIHKDTYISREGNKITLLNKKGLKVICNNINQVCIFKISGWYFGKVGGMLGVYDNEPYNDFMTKERKIEIDAGAFVQSWKVNENCNVGVSNDEYSPTVWDRRKCETMFNSDTSPLVPCFNTVDPAPYKEMCIQQMGYMQYHPTLTKGFCQIAGAYIDYCKVNAIEMWLPGECYMCEDQEEAIKGGEFSNYFDNTAPRNADIVLVLQHGPCLSNFNFQMLLHLIETSLVDIGLTNNLYSVVGYGGPGELEEPHTFTSRGKIFNSADTIPDTVQR